MGFDIALVVLTHNSDLLKTIATLESARIQEGTRFKVVVADDGSLNGILSVVERYMADAGFESYDVVSRDENVGTVKNLRDALDYADAPFVKLISPGDYLYGHDSLAAVANAMAKDSLAFCFGRSVYYRYTGGTPKVLRMQRPEVLSPYVGPKADARTAKRNQLRHGDIACGASLAYDTEILGNCLDTLSANYVKLCEDQSVKLMLLDSRSFGFLDRYLIWYEYGTGVSTDPDNAGNEIVLSDERRTAELLCRMYPDDPDVLAYYRRLHGPRGRQLCARVGRALRDPGHITYWLRMKAARLVGRTPRVDMDNYVEIVGAASEWIAALDSMTLAGGPCIS